MIKRLLAFLVVIAVFTGASYAATSEREDLGPGKSPYHVTPRSNEIVVTQRRGRSINPWSNNNQRRPQRQRPNAEQKRIERQLLREKRADQRRAHQKTLQKAREQKRLERENLAKVKAEQHQLREQKLGGQKAQERADERDGGTVAILAPKQNFVPLRLQNRLDRLSTRFSPSRGDSGTSDGGSGSRSSPPPNGGNGNGGGRNPGGGNSFGNGDNVPPDRSSLSPIFNSSVRLKLSPQIHAKIQILKNIVPGNVRSRINLSEGATRFTPFNERGIPVKAGWRHVVDGHFGNNNNQSQFSISQSEAKILIQSKIVVSSRIIEIKMIHGTRTFVRIVDTGNIIGVTRKSDGRLPTSVIYVQTDLAGNLITAYPVPK